MTLARGPWSHSIQYHDIVLDQVRVPCGRALEVGCGEGILARLLAARCVAVLALDLDGNVWRGEVPANVKFLVGDIVTAPLQVGSFDLVTAVAVLHHLPLRAGLERLRELVAPGGVLVVVGLYRAEGVVDAAWSGVGLVASLAMRLVKGRPGASAMRLAEPRETLGEIRQDAGKVMPECVVRRRLLFRYTLVWHRAR